MKKLVTRYAKLIIILLIVMATLGLLFYLPLSMVRIKEGDNYIINSDGSLVSSMKIKSGFNDIHIDGPYVKTTIKVFNIPFITKTINNNFEDNVSLESIAYKQLINNGQEPGVVNGCKKFENYWVVCNHYTSFVKPFYMNYNTSDKSWILYYVDIVADNITNTNARNYYSELSVSNQTYADY